MKPKRSKKFFVFEGGDGSGKATQVRYLKKHLEREGYKIKTIAFPRYGADSCKLVDWYLDSLIYKKADEADPKLTAMYYIYDQWVANKRIKKWLKEEYIVLADRYCTSNKGHQLGKIQSTRKRREYLEWLNNLVYNELNFALSAKVIYLDTHLAIAAKHKQKQRARQQKNKDLHEMDKSHLKKAVGGYFWVTKNDNYDKWKIIKCSKNKVILSRKEIHNRILKEVEKSL